MSVEKAIGRKKIFILIEYLKIKEINAIYAVIEAIKRETAN